MKLSYKKVKFIFHIASLIFVLQNSILRATQILDLGTTAKIILEKNSIALRSKAEINESNSLLAAAKSGYAPEVMIHAGWSRGNHPVYAFGTLLSQSRFETGDFQLDRLNHPSALENFQGQIGLQMRLFNSQRSKKIEVTRSFQKISKENQKEVTRQLLLNTIETFYGLILAEEQAKLLRERILESEEELKEALQLKNQGLVLGSDFHLGQVLLGQMKQQFLQTQSQIEIARSALENLMENGETSDFKVSGSLTNKKLPAIQYKEFDAKNLDHPMMKISEHSLSGARAELEAAQKSFWPMLNGFSTVEGNGNGLNGGGWNYIAGLRLDMPLFDPAYRARKSKSQAFYDKTQADKKILKNRIIMELKRQVEQYKSAGEKLPIAQQTVSEAGKALQMFRKLYKSGRQSIADVMQGEMALAQSQSSLNQNYYDLCLNYARVLWAAGKLNDVPEELK